MKKLFLSLFLMGAIALLMSGCNSTSTITEFDKDGHVTKVTETKEAVVDQVTKSTKDKTCFVWCSGWIAKIKCEFFGSESPMPNVDMEGGNVDKGVLTIHKDQQNMAELEKIIKAARSNSVSFGATGVSSSSGSASASNSNTGGSASSGTTPAATTTTTK